MKLLKIIFAILLSFNLTLANGNVKLTFNSDKYLVTKVASEPTKTTKEDVKNEVKEETTKEEKKETTEEFVIVTEKIGPGLIQYQTEYIYSDELYEGEQRIVRQGSFGSHYTHMVLKKDKQGNVIEIISKEDVHLDDPINEIIMIGTKKYTQPEPDTQPEITQEEPVITTKSE